MPFTVIATHMKTETLFVYCMYMSKVRQTEKEEIKCSNYPSKCSLLFRSPSLTPPHLLLCQFQKWVQSTVASVNWVQSPLASIPQASVPLASIHLATVRRSPNCEPQHELE